MNGIEGAGGADVSYQLSVRAVQGMSEGNASEDGTARAGLEGAVSLSRKLLRAALNDAGFVDLHSSNIERLKFFLERSQSVSEEVESDLDPRTASELAAQFGEQVTGQANLALRLLAHVDPERVAALLK